MPSFEKGVYELSKAVNVRFYRFRLGGSAIRFDGTIITGQLTIERDVDGYIAGSIMADVSGETKSFDEPTRPFKTVMVGSFKIKEVPLEATKMKGR